jgi:hypothetical protein
MKSPVVELRLEDLLLTQSEVRKNKVGRLVMKYFGGEKIEPVSVVYCVHTGKYMLDDGHHRAIAAHFLGRTTIPAESEPCFLYECPGGIPSDCPPFINIRYIRME